MKLVPSMRNMFSLTADPNTDTVLTEPLAGEVGETPGVLLIRLNMLYRRDGIGHGCTRTRTEFPGRLSGS